MPTGRFATGRGGNRLWVIAADILLLALLAALPLGAQRGTVTSIEQPLPPPGDPANGKALLESNKCLDCHRIGGTGSRLGPDLSNIGSVRSPAILQRAVVAPDADVLPEHRFVRLITKDGTTVVGRLLNQDAFSIQLMNAQEQLKSYAKSNLREYAIVDKGLMPSYEGKLTQQQVNDIVNYLASLKGAEK
jgi:putative heme-binding domain-containing protein